MKSTLVLAALATLTVAGCGGGATAAAVRSPSPAATFPSPSPSPSPSPETARTLTFALKPSANQSHVGGTVKVDVQAFSYTITMTITGLDPNSGHEINMHAGSCDAIDTDDYLKHIDHVTANAQGVATSTTTWQLQWEVPSLGRVMTVHGDDPTNGYTDQSFVHYGCADLTN
jgi:hypothetical protein